MNGLERIQEAFSNRRRAVLMPYFTLGYPDLPTSLDIIAACCASGAALMELGVPFSDPLADGPTIQHSTQVALQNGMSVRECLKAVSKLRARGITTPFLLMGYVNPILRYGMEKFTPDAHASGADGFIIPDLPPDEAGAFSSLCEEKGMALVHLLAPNSTDERVDLVLAHSRAFVYLVSITGITGEQNALPETLNDFIGRIRAISKDKIPLAVGFGIGSPAQAKSVAAQADGVIVGSALINITRRAVETGLDPVAAAADFIKSLTEAIN